MDWLAVLDPTRDGGRRLRVVSATGGPPPRLARASDCTLLFSGELHEDVPGAEADRGPDEQRVLSAYLREGVDVFPRLRGCFAFLLDDRRHDRLYVVRDPMGAHPLFYSANGETLYVSTSAETASRRDRRRPALNRLATAAFLLGISPDGQETFFHGVQRLLQGHLLESRSGARVVRRYWHPEAEPAYDPGELDARLRRAVERLVDGQIGIFLSGGLDSALVAAIAGNVARARGEPPPVALSLALRGSDADEEAMQREVAARLGLELVLHTPRELVGADGLLRATLALARHPLPCPPELLAPAYEELSRLAVGLGVRTILSGTGGDELLLPAAGYATDRALALDLPALAQLVRAWAGYWPGRQPFAALGGVLWRSGLRAAGRDLLLATGGRLDQDRARRLMRRRAAHRIPSWLAPDGDLRAALLDRLTTGAMPVGHRGTIARERQGLLDRSSLSLAQELSFEMHNRSGVTAPFPLLDPDVVDLLFALPPRLLLGGGRAKAPARDVLFRYLPELVPAWPRTVYGNSFWIETIRTGWQRAWSALNGLDRLAANEIVDPQGLERRLASHGPEDAELLTAWLALSAESWLRGIEQRTDRL